MELMENPNFMERTFPDAGDKSFQDKTADSPPEVIGRKGIILGKLAFCLLLLGLFLVLKSIPSVRGINPATFCMKDTWHEFFINYNRVIHSNRAMNRGLIIMSSLMIDCTMIHGALLW